MPTLTPTQSGHDMSRKFFTEAVKRWAEQELDSPEQVAFVVDMMDGAYELVVDSARNGGAPSNADVRKFLLKRSAKFVGMADASMVQCAVALIDLGYTATAYSKVAAMPVVGYVVYGSMLVLDGLTAGGECYLAYEDRRIEREIRAFEQQLTDRKAWAKSNAAVADEGGAGFPQHARMEGAPADAVYGAGLGSGIQAPVSYGAGCWALALRPRADSAS